MLARTKASEKVLKILMLKEKKCIPKAREREEEGKRISKMAETR